MDTIAEDVAPGTPIMDDTANDTVQPGPIRSLRDVATFPPRMDFSGLHDIVRIIVGDETSGPLVCVIHEELATRYSEHFAGAFRHGNFIEGATKELKLEEEDPDTFRLVVNWLYYQSITHPNGPPVNLVEYCKLWVLAEYLIMPRLQNEAMICIINDVGHHFISHTESREELAVTVAEFFKYAYGNGNQDGPLQLVCMEIMLPELNLGSRSQETVELMYETAFGPGMALDMVKRMCRARVDFTKDYKRPPIQDFFVGDAEEIEFSKQRMARRKRGMSEVQTRGS